MKKKEEAHKNKQSKDEHTHTTGLQNNPGHTRLHVQFKHCCWTLNINLRGEFHTYSEQAGLCSLI